MQKNNVFISGLLWLMYLTNANAQTKVIIPGSNDIYALRVTIDTFLYAGPCDCEFNSMLRSTCRLYKMTIDSVLYRIDQAVYPDDKALRDVAFMVAWDSLPQLHQGTDYLVLAANSNVHDYLIATQVVEFENAILQPKKWYSYSTGLVQCKQLTLGEKIMLRLGFNRKRIFTQARDRPKHCNKFWLKIQELQTSKK